MIQKTFENEVVGRMQSKEWFVWFKEGQISVETDEHSWRHSMCRNQLMIDKVHSAMLDNKRITISKLSEKLWLSSG
jgi:hypothetical protein